KILMNLANSMGALGGNGRYTALDLRMQGQSGQGWSECFHARLPGALLNEYPDCRVRKRGSQKIMLIDQVGHLEWTTRWTTFFMYLDVSGICRRTEGKL